MIWRRHILPWVEVAAVGIVLSWAVEHVRVALTPRTEFFGCTKEIKLLPGVGVVEVMHCDASKPLQMHIDGAKQEAQTWTPYR